MNVEVYSYSLFTTILGMLVVFLSLSALSVMMVVLKRIFSGEEKKGGSGSRKGERNLKDSSRDILAELADYPGRILFIHGSKDPEGMVGREHFMAFSLGRRLSHEFHLVEGANHSFYSLAWEQEILEMTLTFLTADLSS